MTGTKLGGARAAQTNKNRHGAGFYPKIGALGGKKSRTGGFYANRELARIVGKKGGQAAKKARALKTHCLRGHPLNPQTVHTYQLKT
ncbi:hypothetical protein H0X10_04660, partial [Candidatus Saccharibacteria bacterium]|nr:hypothetical protein [Candidatus Saccharibacteria bacterium]